MIRIPSVNKNEDPVWVRPEDVLVLVPFEDSSFPSPENLHGTLVVFRDRHAQEGLQIHGMTTDRVASYLFPNDYVSQVLTED